MAHFIKLLAGILLLPLCYTATRATFDLVASVRPESYEGMSLSAWGLTAGFALWLALYFGMPRPVRTYVLAHELTHALWAALMGARVSRLRISKRGGSVKVSKTNFLITLAPYFFPLYTFCILAGYYALSVFFDLRAYEPLWLGSIGFTWGFHLTFTVSTLMNHQPDIVEHGRIFSYAVIYLLNVVSIGIWIVLVSEPDIEEYSILLSSHTRQAWETSRDFCLAAWEGGRSLYGAWTR